MGTKNNPGKFDCYTKAEPDEPMFILLARDPLAPILVNLWAQLKVLESGYLSEKTSEAVDTALAMQIYRQQLKDRCDICHNTPPPGYPCPACGHILD